MSQIEQDFRLFLSKKPEIEMCYQENLINRRSLARYLIKKGIGKSNQIDAVIAMLRRFNYEEHEKPKNLFPKIKISIKDKILILDFEKEKELIQKLQNVIKKTNYDKGDTLKIVIGSTSVKVFIDEDKEETIKEITLQFKLKNKLKHISEISLQFPDDAVSEKGIISTISRELYTNDITISEILTASPELLIYVKEEFVIKTYDIIKRLQN